ncbi:MAG: mannose-1-phosphate guanylyltransferase, partial [Bacteroidales bacterium]|nr:mannose-1-phosphate guanylyltransferase [Bacteroidales bacterium]
MTEHIVLLAGGVGSRLFPISTPERPKQFLDLLGCG